MYRKRIVLKYLGWERLYFSDRKVTFPIVMKMEGKDYVRRNVVANIINSDEVNFLCKKKQLKDRKHKQTWRTINLNQRPRQDSRAQIIGRRSSIGKIGNGW